MKITFERPEEAYISVAWVVISADKVGSLEERSFLHRQVSSLEVFSSYSEEKFSELAGACYLKAAQLFLEDDGEITIENTESLISGVREIVNESEWITLYDMACGIACSDELHDLEIVFIDRLQRGLGISDATAQEILEKYQGMSE